jgi:hypothetical protein
MLSRDVQAAQLEIRGLVEAYARAMDRADVSAFTELIAPDGALVVRGRGGDSVMGVFEGPAGVGLIARLLGEIYVATLHNITTHHVIIDGKSASGVTYCLAYHVVGGADGDQLETLGVRYEDRYVCTDGAWRIQNRDATRLWSQITPTPHEPLLIDRAAGRSRAAVSDG